MHSSHDKALAKGPFLRDSARAVVLVGFMGAGKTSVGQELARMLGWRFVDLDDRITAREGRSVAQIFAESGEATFRAAESGALADMVGELAGAAPCVLALGGGAFVQQANQDLLKKASLPVLWLDASVEELAARCGGSAERPLARDLDQFRHLYEQRRARYMEADVRIDTSRLAVREVARQIVKSLRLTRLTSSAAKGCG